MHSPLALVLASAACTASLPWPSACHPHGAMMLQERGDWACTRSATREGRKYAPDGVAGRMSSVSGVRDGRGQRRTVPCGRRFYFRERCPLPGLGSLATGAGATVAAKGTRLHQTYKKRICSGRRFDHLAVTPTKQSNGKREAVAADTEQSGTVKPSDGFLAVDEFRVGRITSTSRAGIVQGR